MLADTIIPHRSALLSFLREELEPRPGRIAAVVRIAGSCAVVVAVAMLYQIPLPAYMAYIVFLISREEAASTLLTGVVGVAAATLAVALSLLFYTLDASEPALRLPLMAVGTFGGMFLARTMALGPVAFLAAFILVLSQTLIDQVPTLEVLTRLLLWLWVVVTIPVALTVLVNLTIGESPTRLAHRTARRLLGELATALRQGPAATLPHCQAEAVALLELRQRAVMLDHDLRGRTAIDTMLIETLSELFTLLWVLPADTPPAARLPLAEICEACARGFDEGRDAPSMALLPSETVLTSLSAEARPVIIALGEALTRLVDGLARRRMTDDRPALPSAKAILAPDAFSNPDHARFALKTTIAVMAAYAIYSGLDWPGISTSITTCFFVALGSLGETMHKLTLRITGAAIGGLAGGLCIVYLLPQLTDIGQLCILIFAVSCACAWISTSSDRLAYAGMQIAFAFFLGVLQDYGPATDLTGLRDRVVGILLGNLLMSLVFSVLWPTSAADRARLARATVFRALGHLLTSKAQSPAGQRFAVVQALDNARRFAAIVIFELRMLPKRTSPDRNDPATPEALNRIAGAAFAVIEQPADTVISPALRQDDDAVSAWLLTWAGQLSAGETAAARAAFPVPAAVIPRDDAPLARRAAVEARTILRSEIQNALAVGA